MSNSIIVLKFGGSCLSQPAVVLRAAREVAREAKSGKRVVVVVSALKGVTDELLDAAKKASSNNVSNEDLDEILSIGERTTVRLMTSALKSLGLNAVGIDPLSDLWPIYTDSNFGDAKVELEKTKEMVSEKILPLLNEGSIPVLAGFVGLSSYGKITTLGRGGSDVSAVVLGNCLDAEEVILVKDVGGVMSADPKEVAQPQTIHSLEAEEAYLLASAGAKVVHPTALRYKKDSTILRVVGFDSIDLSGGTVINGVLKIGLKASLYSSQLSMITLIGNDVASQSVLKVLAKADETNTNIIGVTLASSSLLVYVETPSNLSEHLHELIKTQSIAKALHSFGPLAMIVVSGYGIERIPGIIDVVVKPLAKENINLYGVLTISSSIRIFIPWEEREKALTFIAEELKKFEGEMDND